MVRFGTKCPSMISTWMTLAPPSAAARTCSPSRAKSAERIEGASSINVDSQNEILEPGRSGNDVQKFYHGESDLSANLRVPGQRIASFLATNVAPEVCSAHGFNEATYAPIAAMSSMVSLLTTGFIRWAATPARAPLRIS
jgi:hypothetical protein